MSNKEKGTEADPPVEGLAVVPRLWYWPNRAHKTEPTEAGPPGWYPDKTACPNDLSLAERVELLEVSVDEEGDPLEPQRYAVRRKEGRLEWFTSRLTRRHPDGKIEVHGFPFEPGFPRVPTKVLRRLRDSGLITSPEYKELV